MKTSTSETTVHARVRLHNIIVIHTRQVPLFLASSLYRSLVIYTCILKRYPNGACTGPRTPQKPRDLLEQSTIKLPNSELPFKTPPYAHTQTHYKNEYLFIRTHHHSKSMLRILCTTSETLDRRDDNTWTSTSTEAASATVSRLPPLLEPTYITRCHNGGCTRCTSPQTLVIYKNTKR